MISTNLSVLNMLNSPVRQIAGKAELHISSAKTATGVAAVTVNDVSPIKHKLGVKLESKENKNLIPYPYPDTTKTINGITFTDNGDGSITLNGTAGESAYFSIMGTTVFSKGGYVISGNAAAGCDMVAFLYGNNGSVTTIVQNNDTAATFSLTEDTEIHISFFVNEGATLESVTIYPQISADFTGVEVKRYGNNLLEEPIIYTANADGTVEGVTSLYPTTTLITDNNDVIINLNYTAGAITDTYSHTDALKSFTVDRVGEESKFFGFGVCHKLNVKLIDKERALNITTVNSFVPLYEVEGNLISPYPAFYVTEVNRDENTNELSITAYDALYKAEKYTVADLELFNTNGYTILEFATACAALLGLTVNIENVTDDIFNTHYETGANFEGTEGIRQALNAVAEVTQTIYYINKDSELTFKRLSKDADSVFTIDKAKYITLDSKTNRRLSAITHATELGDNVTASIDESGSTQFIRDNPFLELRDDIAALLDNAIANVGGLTINQFNCSWRGNFLLEIGDKIELITKDNESVFSFVLNDSITYSGGLAESTQWSYTDNDSETASNPTTLGETLKKTFAKVDKANKQIDIVASETAANSAAISALQINTESINTSVEKVSKESTEAIEAVNENISTLTQKVEAQITAEDVTLEIQKELANGTTTVKTSTGFTFNEEGLNVSKSGAEMSTKITEDGMTVSKNNEEVLKANNEGVTAIDLHATTYLIVGTNSRFENYGSDRTGCFWIGGNS